MKIFITTLFLFLYLSLYSQVGIGTNTPNLASILDIQSVNKGILIPRVTLVNRTSMPNVQGMLVYDTTKNHFFYNDGSGWFSIISVFNDLQSGTINIGDTVNGWQYYNVVFSKPFNSIPIVTITYREGVGIDNIGSYSIQQVKTANVSTTGFTIAINETAITHDVYIDWIATKKTQ